MNQDNNITGTNFKGDTFKTQWGVLNRGLPLTIEIKPVKNGRKTGKSSFVRGLFDSVQSYYGSHYVNLKIVGNSPIWGENARCSPKIIGWEDREKITSVSTKQIVNIL